MFTLLLQQIISFADGVDSTHQILESLDPRVQDLLLLSLGQRLQSLFFLSSPVDSVVPLRVCFAVSGPISVVCFQFSGSDLGSVHCSPCSNLLIQPPPWVCLYNLYPVSFFFQSVIFLLFQQDPQESLIICFFGGPLAPECVAFVSPSPPPSIVVLGYRICVLFCVYLGF